MKKNIKIILSYDGTRFFGWEHQKNKALTIQGKLENVLYRMLIKEEYKDEPFISKESLNDITGSKSETLIFGGAEMLSKKPQVCQDKYYAHQLIVT